MNGNARGESTLPLHLNCDNDHLDAARDRTPSCNPKSRRENHNNTLTEGLQRDHKHVMDVNWRCIKILNPAKGGRAFYK